MKHAPELAAFTDRNGNAVTVTAYGCKPPECWVDCKRVIMGESCDSALRLTPSQARRLSRALTKFADGATKKKKGRK